MRSAVLLVLLFTVSTNVECKRKSSKMAVNPANVKSITFSDKQGFHNDSQEEVVTDRNKITTICSHISQSVPTDRTTVNFKNTLKFCRIYIAMNNNEERDFDYYVIAENGTIIDENFNTCRINSLSVFIE